MVGVAFILATITTTFGFVSNVISDLPAITEFGIIAACGIIFACTLNLSFVPAFRQILDQRRLRKGKELKGVIPPQKIEAEPGRILGLTSKTVLHPWILVIVIILLAIPGYIELPDMRATYDPTGELLETQDIKIAFEALNDDYDVGTEMILVRVDGDLEDPGIWQAINQSLTNAADDEYVSTANGVAKVEWAGTLLATIGRYDPSYQALDNDLDGIPNQNATALEIRAMLDNISAGNTLLEQYIHKDDATGQYDAVVIRVITKTTLGEHGLAAKDELVEDFQPVSALGATIQYTGEPIIWNIGLDDFRESLVSSTLLVIVFAFVLLIVVFGAIYRSPGLGLLTAIPPMLAFGWTLGFMWLAGIPLNMMTAFVGAMTIGLGIDYPIHLVTRWVQERKKGHGIVECYTISLRSTGKELTFSGLTTLSAFVAFALMPMPVMRQFGLVMVVSILFSYLGAVFMMPMLIRFWHRRDDVEEETKSE